MNLGSRSNTSKCHLQLFSVITQVIARFSHLCASPSILTNSIEFFPLIYSSSRHLHVQKSILASRFDPRVFITLFPAFHARHVFSKSDKTRPKPVPSRMRYPNENFRAKPYMPLRAELMRALDYDDYYKDIYSTKNKNQHDISEKSLSSPSISTKLTSSSSSMASLSSLLSSPVSIDQDVTIDHDIDSVPTHSSHHHVDPEKFLYDQKSSLLKHISDRDKKIVKEFLRANDMEGFICWLMSAGTLMGVHGSKNNENTSHISLNSIRNITPSNHDKILQNSLPSFPDMSDETATTLPESLSSDLITFYFMESELPVHENRRKWLRLVELIKLRNTTIKAQEIQKSNVDVKLDDHVIIRSLLLRDQIEEALAIFMDAWERQSQLTLSSYVEMIKAIIYRINDVILALKVLENGKQLGLEFNIEIYNMLLEACIKLDSPDPTHTVLRGILSQNLAVNEKTFSILLEYSRSTHEVDTIIDFFKGLVIMSQARHFSKDILYQIFRATFRWTRDERLGPSAENDDPGQEINRSIRKCLTLWHWALEQQLDVSADAIDLILYYAASKGRAAAVLETWREMRSAWLRVPSTKTVKALIICIADKTSYDVERVWDVVRKSVGLGDNIDELASLMRAFAIRGEIDKVLKTGTRILNSDNSGNPSSQEILFEIIRCYAHCGLLSDIKNIIQKRHETEPVDCEILLQLFTPLVTSWRIIIPPQDHSKGIFETFIELFITTSEVISDPKRSELLRRKTLDVLNQWTAWHRAQTGYLNWFQVQSSIFESPQLSKLIQEHNETHNLSQASRTNLHPGQSILDIDRMASVIIYSIVERLFKIKSMTIDDMLDLMDLPEPKR